MDVEKVLKENCGELLKRYPSFYQQQLIIDYWNTVRFTRKTGKISINIIKTEMDYWQKFEVEVVMEALKTHINQRREYKESYTRGIMRNMQEDKNSGKCWRNKQSNIKQQKSQKQSPDNFKTTPRDLEFLVQ